MAKVLGYDPQLLKQCKCRECTAIIEYGEREVEVYIERDYGGGSERIKFIRCPSCGAEVRV